MINSIIGSREEAKVPFFSRIFTYTDNFLYYFRLGVRVNECPGELGKWPGLEPPTGDIIRRKATVKIRRNPALRILPLIQIIKFALFQNTNQLETFMKITRLFDKSFKRTYRLQTNIEILLINFHF